MKEQPMLLQAISGKELSRPPVWLMRQAGRYLPEYREIRASTDFLGLCTTPELAAEVTIQPIKRFGMDAAILFSDLLVPLTGMGFDLYYDEQGPGISNPIAVAADVGRVKPFSAIEHTPYVSQSICLVKERLGAIPLIGFAGAPWTLAAYVIEGGGSKNYSQAKRFYYSNPEAMFKLMDLFAEAIIGFLRFQIENGVQMVQVFDSWADVLAPMDYELLCQRYHEKIIGALKPMNAPVVLFARGSAAHFERMANTQANALSVDWSLEMQQAREIAGPLRCLQGNMDPSILLGPRKRVVDETRRVLRAMRGHSRFIFNLGHGILPSTPVENVQALVETVQAGPEAGI